MSKVEIYGKNASEETIKMLSESIDRLAVAITEHGGQKDITIHIVGSVAHMQVHSPRYQAGEVPYCPDKVADAVLESLAEATK